MQKKNSDDFEQFKNFTRTLNARTNAYAHFLRAFIDLKLTGQILTLIMINMNEKITFRYEDMIISWFSQNGAWMTSTVILSLWKSHAVLS